MTRAHQSNQRGGEQRRAEPLGPSGCLAKISEQARTAQASYRISQWLPLEEPTRHRKAQRCVTKVNKSHKTHPIDGQLRFLATGETATYSNSRQLISEYPEGQ